MGFVSGKETKDWTKLLMLSSSIYGLHNDDGFGYSFWSGGKFNTTRANYAAKEYWLKTDANVVTNCLILHCRAKTSGNIDEVSTHPFNGCRSDKYQLIHNGVLWNYDKAREKLKTLGHTFVSEVDSEVLIHGWEEWGDDFITKLSDLGVNGYAAIIITEKNKETPTIWAYSDGRNLGYYKFKESIVAFSDDSILSDKGFNAFQEHFLYEIQEGKILHKKKIGELRGNYAVTTFDNRNGLRKKDEDANIEKIQSNLDFSLRDSFYIGPFFRTMEDGTHAFCQFCRQEISCKNEDNFISNVCGKCENKADKCTICNRLYAGGSGKVKNKACIRCLTTMAALHKGSGNFWKDGIDSEEARLADSEYEMFR